jgi:hypothetical protein
MTKKQKTGIGMATRTNKKCPHFYYEEMASGYEREWCSLEDKPCVEKVPIKCQAFINHYNFIQTFED